MQRPPSRRSQGNVQFDEVDWDRLRPLLIFGPIVLLVLIIGWTSVYTVQTDGEAVVKRFGKVVDVRGPGLHFKLPLGIDRAHFVPTARQLKEEFGFRTVTPGQRSTFAKSREHLDESLMLTGDLKVIDVEWVVQFRINDPNLYLHRIREPQRTIRDLCEAVMRRIVGNNLGSDVLTEKRVLVARSAAQELQLILDSMEAGITITTIELQDVNPPEQVKPAFNEVNQAEQERERLINEAEKRRNQVLPQAQGQAEQLRAEARAYENERVNRARGEADRFIAILNEYRNSPEIMRRRLFIEMIDEVLPKVGRIVVMEENGTAPIPLLNLGGPDLLPAASPATGGTGGRR